MLAIVVGGWIIGTLDIGAAALINRTNPISVLKVVAGGLLGRPAIGGGAATAAIGYGLQVAMSILIAAIYALASLRFPVLTRLWLGGGLVYGAIIFVVMNYVVVPLSALRTTPHFKPLVMAGHVSAMLAFGVAVAFAAYLGSRAPSA